MNESATAGVWAQCLHHNGISGPQTTDSPTICVKNPIQSVHPRCTGFSAFMAERCQIPDTPSGFISIWKPQQTFWMDTGIKPGSEEKEKRRKVKSKCFLGDFCICSSQAAEVVNQPFSSYCIYFNSSLKSPHTGMQPLLHGVMKRGMALILSLFHIFILVDGFLSLMQKEGESVGVQKHTSHKS